MRGGELAEAPAPPEDAEPRASPLLRAGESYAHAFAVPDRYEYICIPHVRSDMRGVIVVACQPGKDDSA